MLIQTARPKTASQLNRSRTYYYSTLKNLSFKEIKFYRLKENVVKKSVLQRFRHVLQTKNRKELSRTPAQRDMATASPFPADDIPFDKLNRPPLSIMGTRNEFLRPIILSNSSYANIFRAREEMASKKFSRGRLGITGNLYDILPVFEACVHLGRLERAKDILDKLHDKVLPEYDAIRCTNIYLKAAVEQIMMNPKREINMERIHQWFEINHRAKAVPHDSETIAYMVKLSLQSSPSRHKRLIQKYMDFLDEDSFIEMIESDILSGHEISLMSNVYPKYNFVLEPESETPVEDLMKDAHKPHKKTKTNESKLSQTEQKGIGLYTLKKSLSFFEKSCHEDFNFDTATYEQKRQFQRRLEEDAVQSAIDRWKNEHESLKRMGINSNLQKGQLGAQMWSWQVELEKKIKEELVHIAEAEVSETKNREDVDRCLYGPLLQILPPSQISAITIITSMTIVGQYTDKRTTLSSIVLEIGKNIEDESTLLMLQKVLNKSADSSDKKRRLNPEFYMKLRRSRGAGAAANHINYHFAEDGAKPWPPALRAKVGALLISHLIEIAKVPAHVHHPETNEELVQMQPAFTHAHQYKKGKKTGVILPNKVLLEQLQREPVRCLLAKQLPMLVKPDKWTGFKRGGYLLHPSDIVRIKFGDLDQRHYCEAAIVQGNMSLTFQGLDVLGKTPWKINCAVFDVIQEAWNTGESIANFPSLNPQIEIPVEPISSSNPLERRRWIQQVKIAQNIKTGLHSQRCFQNFQLEVAQALKNREFYFPHNMDFRGRAYPIPPYLNHIGADHCRGLLMFAHGKELGENGLTWLKIHLSNVYGYDKSSLQEREAFTTSKIEEISDSALNPLTGKRWWLTAENPWQCLAACMELKNALDSPDPKKYISNLPVHQDGTCNGLQHYAALGGDSWGARQVNLEPGDRPADVYSAVADLVKESIAKDKLAGSKIADYLEGKITRKTVKQTVMTNVYGVTFIGASAQVRKQLAANSSKFSKDESKNRQNASAYIARKIFDALSTMFRGAHDIQRWFGECASRITTSLSSHQLLKLEAEFESLCNSTAYNPHESFKPKKQSGTSDIEEMTMYTSSLIWTSPTGMPVVQPYRTTKGRMIRTNMQYINLSEPQKISPVNKRKQLQGFPPNFIHSLDASHMFLSAIGCDKLGLSFAAVHDSFWTHACDVDTINRVLREKFIEIHSDDLIGRLDAEFKARYHNSMYLAKVKSSIELRKAISSWRTKMRLDTNSEFKSYNIEPKILRNIYELLQEWKRFKLLSSSDPRDVQKGSEMITPASIFEAYGPKDYDHGNNKMDNESSGIIDFEDVLIDNSYSDRYSQAEEKEDKEEEENSVAYMNIESSEHDICLSEDRIEDLEDIKNVEDREMSEVKKRLKEIPKKGSPKNEFIWRPLTFPEVPKKGEFDVNRLRDSKYFFS